MGSAQRLMEHALFITRLRRKRYLNSNDFDSRLKLLCEQMPVCSFFLRGVCARDGCPYLHVSVGKNAEVCPDFVKGYCAKGEQVGGQT